MGCLLFHKWYNYEGLLFQERVCFKCFVRQQLRLCSWMNWHDKNYPHAHEGCNCSKCRKENP